MAHVGIERLATGDGQHHGTQRHPGHHAVVQKEAHRPCRIEGLQHLGVAHDAADAGRGDGGKPQAGDRPKHLAHLPGAEELEGEQHQQNGDRQRHDVRVQRRGRDLEALHGTEH